MAASAQPSPPSEPPRVRRIGQIGFRTTEDESLLIRRAAELQGWTVTQYMLCAVLDRAERDLYEHAARVDHMVRRCAVPDAAPDAAPDLEPAAEPLLALACVYGR